MKHENGNREPREGGACSPDKYSPSCNAFEDLAWLDCDDSCVFYNFPFTFGYLGKNPDGPMVCL